jgi:hypothetical protein
MALFAPPPNSAGLAAAVAPLESRRALPEPSDEALLIWSNVCLGRRQFISGNFGSKYRSRELMPLPAETSEISSAKSPPYPGRPALPALLQVSTCTHYALCLSQFTIA